jgi:FkbM family methyltransferase
VHHQVFSNFQAKSVVGTGQHVFDFLGGRTNVLFKRAWTKHALKPGSTVVPNYPSVNEHYFDWIALLQSVERAGPNFQMIELGAGWGTWAVNAWNACGQKEGIFSCRLMAVEAEPTHFKWLLQHFEENGIDLGDHMLINAAVSEQGGILRFPYLDNPDEDYGASLRSVTNSTRTFPVKACSLSDLFEKMDGEIDLLHVDIQGAEYDVIPPAMDLLDRRVRAVMLGTHISLERHLEMKSLFEKQGWHCVYAFDRNGECQTEFGMVTFGDGFLYYLNPRLIDI